jgi:hypothetical protein
MDANRVATVTARLITIARVLQPVNGKFFRIIDEAAGIIQILQARVANTADSDRLQSALDAAPVREERVGECWCRRDMLGKRYFMCGWKLVAAYNNGCALTEPVMQGTTFCPHCGASLDADGTARRWKERDA